ncbi:hypothetical protein NL676_023726 [Syzygium grande]|nr:hypothetical protein NL676_023726 [Syzygium grande]
MFEPSASRLQTLPPWIRSSARRLFHIHKQLRLLHGGDATASWRRDIAHLLARLLRLTTKGSNQFCR